MADRLRLNGAERRVLDALCAAVRRAGGPPSLEEIKRAAELSSLASVHFLLDSLRHKGFIRRDPARPRVIQVYCDGVESEQAEPAAAGAPVDEPSGPRSAPGDPGDEEQRTRRVVRSAEVAVAGEAPAPEESAERTGDDHGGVPGRPDDLAASAQAGTAEDRQPEGRVFGRGGRVSTTEPDAATVPLVGQVAAGTPLEAIPGVVEATYRLPRDLVGRGDPLFMVRVSGESMTDAGIHDDDFVVVRRQSTAELGELVVVLVNQDDLDGGAVVKSLGRTDDGRPTLLSANPAYAPMEIEAAEMLGRVVAVIRSLR